MDDCGPDHGPSVGHVFSENDVAEGDRPGELAVDEWREHRGGREPVRGD
jgi:hypothetical protein